MIVADDFGESKDVDLAILDLVQSIEVNYISAFSSIKYELPSEGLLKNISQIKLHNPSLKFGLHYELDFLKGKISLRKQFVEFEKTFGFSPEYIDGHIHIHSIPIIDSLINKFIYSKNILIRNTEILNTGKLELSFSSRYKRMLFSLIHRNMKNVNYMNDSICNIYDLNKPQDFKSLWNFYKDLTERERRDTLFIIHPSLNENSWKYNEYRTLKKEK